MFPPSKFPTTQYSEVSIVTYCTTGPGGIIYLTRIDKYHTREISGGRKIGKFDES